MTEYIREIKSNNPKILLSDGYRKSVHLPPISSDEPRVVFSIVMR